MEKTANSKILEVMKPAAGGASTVLQRVKNTPGVGGEQTTGKAPPPFLELMGV